MKLPPSLPRCAIPGSVIPASHSVLFTLLAKILSKASSGSPVSGPKYGLVAAFATTTSSRPHFASVASTSACSSSLRDTLQGFAMASKPCFLSSDRTSSQDSAFLLEMQTLAPARASSSAIDLPMPRVEPVTRATLPLRSNNDDFTVRNPV